MYNYVEKLQLYCLLTSLQLLKEHICNFLKKKENNKKKMSFQLSMHDRYIILVLPDYAALQNRGT